MRKTVAERREIEKRRRARLFLESFTKGNPRRGNIVRRDDITGHHEFEHVKGTDQAPDLTGGFMVVKYWMS